MNKDGHDDVTARSLPLEPKGFQVLQILENGFRVTLNVVECFVWQLSCSELGKIGRFLSFIKESLTFLDSC